MGHIINPDGEYRLLQQRRVFTPETIFDQTISMAIERGKLADLLFDEPEKLSHRALGRMVAILEKSPPFKAAMAIALLRSTFLKCLLRGQRGGWEIWLRYLSDTDGRLLGYLIMGCTGQRK